MAAKKSAKKPAKKAAKKTGRTRHRRLALWDIRVRWNSGHSAVITARAHTKQHAVNLALERARELAQSELSRATGGLPLPPGLFGS